MAVQCIAIVLAGWALSPATAADHDQPVVANAPAVKTGKERLTDKASDEQRVDDCKVAQARRTRPRPTGCTAGAGG
jgi:opacity protein-like surface antigen